MYWLEFLGGLIWLLVLVGLLALTISRFKY